MTAADIDGISPWCPITPELIQVAGSWTGVYVIGRNLGQKMQRINGETDILFLGSGRCLRKTMRELGIQATGSMNLFTNKLSNLCVALSGTAQEPDVLQQYETDHLESPPLNEEYRDPSPWRISHFDYANFISTAKWKTWTGSNVGVPDCDAVCVVRLPGDQKVKRLRYSSSVV